MLYYVTICTTVDKIMNIIKLKGGGGLQPPKPPPLDPTMGGGGGVGECIS